MMAVAVANIHIKGAPGVAFYEFGYAGMDRRGSSVRLPAGPDQVKTQERSPNAIALAGK